MASGAWELNRTSTPGKILADGLIVQANSLLLIMLVVGIEVAVATSNETYRVSAITAAGMALLVFGTLSIRRLIRWRRRRRNPA